MDVAKAVSNFLWALLGAAFLVILVSLLINKCNCNGNGGDNKTDTVIITIHDSLPPYIPQPDTIIEVKYLKPSKIIDTITQLELPGEVVIDTNLILKDYYAKVVYNDTVRYKNDSLGVNGYVSISDTVSRNRLGQRKVSFHLDYPQITKTKIVTKNSLISWGIQGGATYMNNSITPYIGIGVQFNVGEGVKRIFKKQK